MASLNHSWLSSPLAETPTFFFSPKSSKLSLVTNSSSPDQSSDAELTVDPVKLALEKAKAYKKLKSEKQNQIVSNVTDDGKKEQLKVSSIDFIGLGFADKKSTRGLPRGLVPVNDYVNDGDDLPEVEIIVGDRTKFAEGENELREDNKDESFDVYKPKVSTWGVFPRPSNISKTFGGGRTLQPGDSVETDEERITRENRTKQLLVAYKESIGLNIDPKLKLECKEALDKGNSLMDSGKLKEALPYYEMVMEKIIFKSELHGLAALQWSICQDSLRKEDKARIMYEKLITHPNPGVSKKAKQFMFSFQAMEMLKVKSSSYMQMNPGYDDYFEAFVKKDDINYKSKEDKEEVMGINETLLYVTLLASPILLVFIVATQKGTIH